MMISTMRRRPFRDIYLWVGITGATTAGLTPLFVRESGIGPLACAAWRLGFAVLFLLPISLSCSLGNRQERKVEFSRRTILLGVLFAGDVMLWQSSITLTNVGVAAFLANLAPVFIVIYRAAFFHRIPGILSGGAVTLATCGSYLLASPVLDLGGANALGAALAVAASAVFAIFLMVSEVAPTPCNEIARYTGLTISAFPIVLVSALFLERQLGPTTVTGLAWLAGLAAIVHCLAFYLVFSSASSIGALSSSVVNLAQPVSAAIIGAVVYGEPLTLMTLVGMSCLAAAILLVAVDRRALLQDDTF